jgi:hypothetical protein
MTKSLYDICTDLVKRHKALKSYTLDNYGQDNMLTIYLDELEESMAVFEEQMTGHREKDLQNAKS